MPLGYSDPKELAALQGGPKRKSAKGKKKSLKEEKADTAEFIHDMRQEIDASWKKTEDWRTRALESYNFAENHQWDQADLDRIAKDDPSRPILTFNDILPVLRILTGIERQAREDFKIRPRTGTDVDAAQIMTELFRYTTDKNKWLWERWQKSNDVYITGKGFVKVGIDYENNLLGDPTMERLMPLTVFEDAMAHKWDGSDRRWVGEGIWMKEDEVKEHWPEFEDQIKLGDWLSSDTGLMPSELLGDTLADISLFLDKKTRRVRVFDYWYTKTYECEVLVDIKKGEASPLTEPIKEMFQSLTLADQRNYRIIRRPMKKVRIATFCNWLLLQDRESPLPHNSLPINRYIGIQYLNEPNGIVEYLKDPARMKNKAYSQAMNHLNRSVNSGWFNDITKGADPNLLEKFGSTPGIVINHKGAKPEPIYPGPISEGQMRLALIAADQIKATSLVNAEMQGVPGRAISGRAIERRQQGGMVGNEDFNDNALLGDTLVGEQVLDCIKYCYTPERAREVVETLSVRDQNGFAAMILQKSRENILDKIESTLNSDYDYIVDRQAALASIRQEEANNMKEIVAEWAQFGQPPMTLIKEALKKQNISEGAMQAIEAELNQILQQMPGQGNGQLVIPPGTI